MRKVKWYVSRDARRNGKIPAWLDGRYQRYEQPIELVFHQDDWARRFGQIQSVGPLIVAALVAAVGNVYEFTSGRALAA